MAMMFVSRKSAEVRPGTARILAMAIAAVVVLVAFLLFVSIAYA
jgi:hypothetical protein